MVSVDSIGHASDQFVPVAWDVLCKVLGHFARHDASDEMGHGDHHVVGVSNATDDFVDLVDHGSR